MNSWPHRWAMRALCWVCTSSRQPSPMLLHQQVTHSCHTWAVHHFDLASSTCLVSICVDCSLNHWKHHKVFLTLQLLCRCSFLWCMRYKLGNFIYEAHYNITNVCPSLQLPYAGTSGGVANPRVRDLLWVSVLFIYSCFNYNCANIKFMIEFFIDYQILKLLYYDTSDSLWWFSQRIHLVSFLLTFYVYADEGISTHI